MISNEYAAGFFDGEGCITMHRYPPAHYLRIDVVVGNTNRDVLLLLQERWAGAMQKQRVHQPHHKQPWHWELSGRKAWDFLRDVTPFLIVKKVEAEIALRHYDRLYGENLQPGTIAKFGREQRVRAAWVTPEEALLREAEWVALQAAKR